jgi:hypothetical protein
MIDDWIADVFLVVPAAHRAAAAQLYASTTGRVEDATPDTFSVALVGIDADELVTHYACRTRIREETLALLPLLAGAIPGAQWYVAAHDEDTAEQAAARVSVAAWLAEHGLALWSEAEEGE